VPPEGECESAWRSVKSVGVGDGSGGAICELDAGIDRVRSKLAGRPRREAAGLNACERSVAAGVVGADGALRLAERRTLVRSSKA
jgi:hypothetical protein